MTEIMTIFIMRNQNLYLITGFRSYLKVMYLAPSFCGEDHFSVISDLSDFTDHPEETIYSFKKPT